jgi:hypothetical protein
MDQSTSSTPAADGYYAEDNVGDDELDLSFLDEKDTGKK